MKLGGECDFSTSQPLVLTTVSRCQLTSASPAVMLSFRLSTFSLTLIHENILIGYQQKRTLKENDKNPSFLPPPFFLLLFLNFYMPSSFSPFLTPPPPFPPQPRSYVSEDPQGVCGLIRVKQIGGKHRC